MQFVTESVLLSSLPDLVQVATQEELDRCIKAHLNTLFHSKTQVIWYEEKSILNCVMKMLLKDLMKLKKRVNSEMKYLNEKLDQCKDMFHGVLLLKNKSR